VVSFAGACCDGRVFDVVTPITVAVLTATPMIAYVPPVGEVGRLPAA
jgi:hypothetical protein